MSVVPWRSELTSNMDPDVAARLSWAQNAPTMWNLQFPHNLLGTAETMFRQNTEKRHGRPERAKSGCRFEPARARSCGMWPGTVRFDGFGSGSARECGHCAPCAPSRAGLPASGNLARAKRCCAQRPLRRRTTSGGLLALSRCTLLAWRAWEPSRRVRRHPTTTVKLTCGSRHQMLGHCAATCSERST